MKCRVRNAAAKLGRLAALAVAAVSGLVMHEARRNWRHRRASASGVSPNRPRPWRSAIPTTIRLDHTRVTDADLVALDGLADNLRRLNLSHTEVSDEGMARIGRMRHLEQLRISSPRVDDDGLQPIADLKRAALPAPARHADHRRGPRSAARPGRRSNRCISTALGSPTPGWRGSSTPCPGCICTSTSTTTRSTRTPPSTLIKANRPRTIDNARISAAAGLYCPLAASAEQTAR